jgi:hypothetical protein
MLGERLYCAGNGARCHTGVVQLVAVGSQEDGVMTRLAAVTNEQLRARREQILAKLGIPLDELHEWATRYALVGDEYDAWERLESIAFLLGESGA